jgi:hypothetical protein
LHYSLYSDTRGVKIPLACQSVFTFYESVSLIWSQGIANIWVNDDNSGFFLPYALAASLSIVGILYIRKASSTTQHVSAIGSYPKSFFAHVLRGEWWVISLSSLLFLFLFIILLMKLYFIQYIRSWISKVWD